MKLFYVFLSLSTLSYTQLSSQEPDSSKVFLIGEQAERFELLSEEYKSTLMDATSNDMDKTHRIYQKLLREIEAFATQMDYEIKGAKMWIKFFFDKDGTIDHIAYHLKPRSKEISSHLLDDLFLKFKKQYKSPVVYESKYAHYASASFPVVSSAKTSNNPQD